MAAAASRQPGCVRDSCYDLADGHRRTSALFRTGYGQRARHLTETAARLFDSAFTPERVESLATNPDNAIEKRAIIQSFCRWERLRNIRNALVRDYPEHSA
jgi:hypothetical protein